MRRAEGAVDATRRAHRHARDASDDDGECQSECVRRKGLHDSRRQFP